MLIEKKCVRSLKNNLPADIEGKDICFGVRVDSNAIRSRLIDIGFTGELEDGEQLLPQGIGSVSSYNAEGKYIKHTDQPKETAYRQAEWTWEQFSGYNQTTTQTKIVDIPYERYPRTFFAPPAEELEIKTNPNGLKYLVSRVVSYDPHTNEQEIIHIINLLLELFGSCEILQTDLISFLPSEIKRLNWDVLPPGEMPWSKLRVKLDEVIAQEPDGNKKVLQKRHEAIASFQPDFVAVGRGGFKGYVVFAFPEKGMFVLESSAVNNATYFMGENWTVLSTMTKAEILSENLHTHRVIHRESWFQQVGAILQTVK